MAKPIRRAALLFAFQIVFAFLKYHWEVVGSLVLGSNEIALISTNLKPV